MPKLILPTPERRKRIQPLLSYLDRRLPEEQRKVLVEVGSFCGDSALAFAEIFETVYCIDAWNAGNYTPGDKDAIARKGQPHLDDAEYTFDERTKDNPRIVKVKCNSAEAAKTWVAQTDVVYVDAGHTYQSCLDDIHAWKKHARILMMGHDHSRSYQGVRQAVAKVFKFPDFVFPDSSWVVDQQYRRNVHKTDMDIHMFAQRLEVIGAVIDDRLLHSLQYNHKNGKWRAKVYFDNGQELFHGEGVGMEDAIYSCWCDLMLRHEEEHIRLSPIFADEVNAFLYGA